MTGVGEATKALGVVADAADVIDDVHDVAKTVDNAVDAGQAAKRGWEVGDDISNLTKAGKSPSWDTVRSRYWKNQAANPSDSMWYELTPSNKARMQRGKAPIGFDGESVNLHHVQGKAQDIYDFIEMSASAHRNFHKTYGYSNFPNIRTMSII